MYCGDADFFIFDTVNVSLGFASPTEFDPGSYSQLEKNFNIDASYPVAVSWLVAIAARWEDFDDFGTTTNGKISTHWQIVDSFALRGTYSTGFRAPTPGQSNAYNVSTQFNLATNELENNGTIPSTSEVAALRGGEPLEPEESESLSLGAIWQAGNFSITLDYYNIELTDRLSISQNFELTQDEIDRLIELGVAGADSLSTFRFFTNAVETETEGFDVVATYSLDSSVGITDFSVAYNHNETEVNKVAQTPEGDDLMSADRVVQLENALPETRYNIAVVHTMNDWRFMARYSYFDDWFDSEDQTDGIVETPDITNSYTTETYDGYGVVDAEVAYTFSDAGLNVVVGANNLFDETPDENPGAAAGSGNQYSQWAPGGFNGQFVYMRLIYDF